jgi:transglutaminase-like putative cysteine protease
MPPAPDLDLGVCLRPTPFIDSDASSVRRFAEARAGDASDAVARAVRLFHAVRDEIRYDPYSFLLTPEELTASATLARGVGFCVPKAILLAAAARALGIPSRLGFADVRNHLTTPRLRALMGTDVFVFHGFTELHLEGRWVKATPTFDRALCERFGVRPLDFDGRADAIFHPFDVAGRRHMEYVRDRGRHADLPYETLLAVVREYYPALAAGTGGRPPRGDFAHEADAARRAAARADDADG